MLTAEWTGLAVSGVDLHGIQRQGKTAAGRMTSRGAATASSLGRKPKVSMDRADRRKRSASLVARSVLRQGGGWP